MNNLGFEKRLTKLRKTYEFAFEDLLLDKEAKIPFDRRRLLDLKKMLLGEVLMTDKLINGLETSLKKLLRCRMIIEISDDESENDSVIIEKERTTYNRFQSLQPNLDDNVVNKSGPEVIKDNTLKVPVSKNYKRIGEYSSMVQKEQYLEHPEEIENPISEPSKIENVKPTSNNRSSSPAYVLKMTKLRPASSYAKPSNNESRNIVTVPYKPTVKLPCKVLKPIKNLNMIKNPTVSKPASFNPRDEAIALKNIKEKIYQKSYLKTNEDDPIGIKSTQTVLEVSTESCSTDIFEIPPLKKTKARRNTIAERPPKTKIKKAKKIAGPKVPKKRKSTVKCPVVEEDLDTTEEFKFDIEIHRDQVSNHSHPEIYTQDWISSRMVDDAEYSITNIPEVETPKNQYDSIDPEGLMEHLTTVPIIRKRGRGRPRLTNKKITTKKKKNEFDPALQIKVENDL